MTSSVCESVNVTEATYLSTGQLADALGVDIRTVRRWIELYNLRWHHRTMGGHFRWVLADVEAALEERHPRGSSGQRPVE